MTSRAHGNWCAAERTILQTIDRQNTSHVESLEDELDAEPVAIDRHCYDLQRKGFIRPVGSGRYQLTAERNDRLRRLHALDG